MAVFLKVLDGLAQISETETRLRLLLSETKPGLHDPRSAKMVLRPRPRPRPGLETTTLAVMVKAFGLKSPNFFSNFILSTKLLRTEWPQTNTQWHHNQCNRMWKIILTWLAHSHFIHCVKFKQKYYQNAQEIVLHQISWDLTLVLPTARSCHCHCIDIWYMPTLTLAGHVCQILQIFPP